MITVAIRNQTMSLVPFRSTLICFADFICRHDGRPRVGELSEKRVCRPSSRNGGASLPRTLDSCSAARSKHLRASDRKNVQCLIYPDQKRNSGELIFIQCFGRSILQCVETATGYAAKQSSSIVIP
jgi:hypothetical protein